MAEHQPPLVLRVWLLEPRQLIWWIATLFMIGATLFALGCVLYLAGNQDKFFLDTVFFSGSIFFTLAAYCQLHQSITVVGIAKTWKQMLRCEFECQPCHIAFLSAFSQFIGTLMFNLNTFNAFFELGWIAQDLLIWTPNILGSILFQLSGSLAVYEVSNRWWCWPSFRHRHGIHWWITFINFIGCVAFLISALLSFVIPDPVSSLLAIWATIFTLLGACCFFISAFLMWTEMSTTGLAT